jgi:hypothetical protein
MRAGILTSSALALLLCAAPAICAPEPPHREPGLWEMRMSIHGVATVQKREICLDKEAEPKIALWGGQAKSRCARDSVEAQPDGSFKIAASCSQGAGGHVEVTGTLTGDTAKAYKVHIVRTTTGAAVWMDNGRLEITTEFRRIGACRPGQKGGDVDAYGKRINLLAPK